MVMIDGATAIAFARARIAVQRAEEEGRWVRDYVPLTKARVEYKQLSDKIADELVGLGWGTSVDILPDLKDGDSQFIENWTEVLDPCHLHSLQELTPPARRL